MKFVLLLLMFVGSSAFAEPVEIKIDAPASGAVECIIDQRVDGRVVVNIEEAGRLECMPMGFGRVSARNSYISSIISGLNSTIVKADGFKCKTDSSYQLNETCELNALIGYRWTSLSGYANCVNTQPSKGSVCMAYSACRANVVRLLSRDGVRGANTSLAQYPLKNEDVLIKLDELIKSKGCGQ